MNKSTKNNENPNAKSHEDMIRKRINLFVSYRLNSMAKSQNHQKK